MPSALRYAYGIDYERKTAESYTLSSHRDCR